MPIELTHFAARAGDHNDRAMKASPLLAAVLEGRLGVSAAVIGEPAPPLAANWDEELAAALPALRGMRDHYDEILSRRATPITALSRCAVALATLPVIAKHRPDAVVVWFDAHADLNTPDSTTTGYLGGLAFAGPLGFWDSGLGSGLALRNAVLVGTRDLDAPEQQLVDNGSVELIPVGDDVADNLRRVINGRPVYVHIDCDVLVPNTVPTDYLVPGGMTINQLRACASVLATSEVVGIEIGELESNTQLGDSGPSALIISAVEPLLNAIDA